MNHLHIFEIKRHRSDTLNLENNGLHDYCICGPSLPLSVKFREIKPKKHDRCIWCAKPKFQSAVCRISRRVLISVRNSHSLWTGALMNPAHQHWYQYISESFLTFFTQKWWLRTYSLYIYKYYATFRVCYSRVRISWRAALRAAAAAVAS